MLKFMGLMNSSWVLDGHDVVTAFNLSGFQTIVDLGGETLLRSLWKNKDPRAPHPTPTPPHPPSARGFDDLPVSALAA